MKLEPRRFSKRELCIIFAPFPMLWLFIGVFVEPALFTFWVTGQRTSSSNALIVGWMPLCFTACYGFCVLAISKGQRGITTTEVFWCALISAFIGYITSPV
jgi:hypothetical protein